MEAQSKSIVPAISDNVSATAGSEATDNKSGLSALHSACNNAFQLQRFPPFAPHSFQRSLRLSQFLLNVEQLPQIICFIVKITHKMVKDVTRWTDSQDNFNYIVLHIIVRSAMHIRCVIKRLNVRPSAPSVSSSSGGLRVCC